MINWTDYEHFGPEEFNEPDEMDPTLIRDIERIRKTAGVPIYITSSYREGDDGEHGEGKGLDISDNMEGKPMASRWRFEVLAAIFRHNINRIGFYDRHFHIGASETRDMDVLWWGVSD